MNKKHILRFDSTAHPFEMVDAEKTYSLTLELSTAEICALSTGDYILAYKERPIDKICCLLQIQAVSQNKLKLEKILEVALGISPSDLTDFPSRVKSKLQDSQARLFEITEEEWGYCIQHLLMRLDAIEGVKKEQASHTDSLPPIGELQKIYFGAPGTGKSRQLVDDSKMLPDANIERVTFYPTYTYQQFVGAYKPTMNGMDVAYRYVPGPFLRQLLKALISSEQYFLLIIEELNRANGAAVFGDLFQLLDREKGESEYPISASEDQIHFFDENIFENDNITTKVKDNIAKLLKRETDEKGRTISLKIILPKNLYIWATMNSADQGVFPLDTAFKRRWEFVYIGINKNEGAISGKLYQFVDAVYDWNVIRKTINDQLLKVTKVNEDKQLGPFFIKLDALDSEEAFMNAFKSKVLMYLFEDAARHNPQSIFCDGLLSYSQICDKLMSEGLKGVLRSCPPHHDDGKAPIQSPPMDGKENEVVKP